MAAEWFLHNASELLALLCFTGLIATVVRWPTSVRRAFLLAFVRAALVRYCGEWGWLIVIILAAIGAMIL